MRLCLLDAFSTDQGDPDVWAALRPLAEVIRHARSTVAEAVARAQGCTAIVINKIPFGAAEFAALPELRYVGLPSTGTNTIDLDAARARGIAVTNVPGYSTSAVAQLVFAQLLHLHTDVAAHDAAVKAGAWARSPDFCFRLRPLGELAGRTLATIGTGAIGGAVARIAVGFGMRHLAVAVPGGSSAGRIPLHQALAEADVVSLHCPLTPRTRGLVDAAFLAALKPGAILVNTGRGALVDEDALRLALANGQLGGACLDVLGQEPPRADHPLLAPTAPWAARLVVTPHLGWLSTDAVTRLATAVADNLAAWQRGEQRNRVD